MSTSNNDLKRTLATLSEIGANINQLAMGQNLPTILTRIVEGAVQAVAAGNVSNSLDTQVENSPSAIIWVYDQSRQEFDLDSRVSAGEPEGASFDDFPRSNGLGRLAVRHRERLLSYEPGTPPLHPLQQEAGAKCLVCYPLIVGDEIVGVLYVYRCEERPFDEIELLILDNFVHLAGMAIQFGRQVGGVNNSLVRKVRETEKLKRAAHLISSRANLDETLQEILSIGLDLTAAQYGSFEMYDKKQDLLVTKALAGSKAHPKDEPPLPINEKSVVGQVALRRESLRIDDLHDSLWRNIYQPLPLDREMRSELAVPLIGAGGGLEGVLNIESPQPHAFTAEDQNLLEALATQAVIAIQEIRLLDAMQEVVEVLLTAPVDDLLKLIIERACELINVSAGYIWTLVNADTLVLRQATAGQRLGEELPINHSFTGRAIRLGQPLTIDDVRTHSDFLKRDLAVEEGWVSAIVVPLLAPQIDVRPVGSFSLYSSHLRDFSDWDKKLLTCLANHAAVAIRDAEYLAQLKETQEQRAMAETFAAVGDVGANLLHQLNNKFGTISVRVQGIEEKCSDALETWPYLAENLQDIANNTQQAMTIVRESMAHLRPTGPQLVKVFPCIQAALRRVNIDSTIEISLIGLDELPRVWAGEKQLEMVFYNLIDNALKSMGDHGKLQIVGGWRRDDVTITVSDTGSGIPLEKQPFIFEFVSAVDRTAETQTSGLGFGLWWAKTFVNRFGGRIQVESVPGQGSAFTVCLSAEQGV